jgi:peptide-methionine (S)-S-oxide reductase
MTIRIMRRGLLVYGAMLAGAVWMAASAGTQSAPPVKPAAAAQAGTSRQADTNAPAGQQGIAIFAGGCFWCMEPPFDELPGVISTTSGYVGGRVANPSYEQVSSGTTGHAEAVEIRYDPARVSYAKLLEVFWRNVDPLTANAQFCDEGEQYRSAIFYRDAEQRRLAEESRAAIEKRYRFGSPIVTQIVPATTFYPAEGYHQDYYKKNPVRYKFYRTSCGRDRRLKEVWGSTPQ